MQIIFYKKFKTCAIVPLMAKPRPKKPLNVKIDGPVLEMAKVNAKKKGMLLYAYVQAALVSYAEAQ